MTAPGGGRGVGRCVRCGLATTRLVTRDLGVHAACEPVPFFEREHSLSVGGKDVHKAVEVGG